MHTSGCPVHPAVFGVYCCVKSFLLPELIRSFIAYAGCIDISGTVECQAAHVKTPDGAALLV